MASTTPITAAFAIYVRKTSVSVWLPIGCPDRESVDAMVAHCLGGSGDYDIARVVERRGGGGSKVYVDKGERHTRAIVPDPPLT